MSYAILFVVVVLLVGGAEVFRRAAAGTHRMVSEAEVLLSEVGVPLDGSVRSYLLGKVKAVSKVVVCDGMWTPRNAAIRVLRLSIEDVLGTGQYHTYRGVLSLEGKKLKSLWTRLGDMQGEAGLLLSDDFQAEKNDLDALIARVG